MNLEQYQKLKEKIIEAVPEIMELKFGCRINNNNGDYIIVWRFLDEVRVVSFDGQPLDSVPSLRIETFNNIGRPIQLADVLRAIKDKYKKWRMEIPAKELLGLLEIWNLATDLDGQTDETKEFLIKILL